ncbi:FAD/NAD(P)-binding protein [Vibrio sp. M250220]|uniref:FAD/NAD(P)-binding protein n=1 Tax=Vibrio sp. M250220 TaxID=3020894 RepID=UPI002F3FFA99
MKNRTVGIIGIGPRGLSVLERIIALSIDTPHQALNIKIFDPNLPGSGCHDVKQPNHLLVNTVSSQITMFADESVSEARNVISGPTFYQWLCERPKDELSPKTILPNEYYSRSLFGEYLNWVFLYLVDIAAPHITIDYLPCEVIDIDKLDNQSWSLRDDRNIVTNVEYLYLTTGHTKVNYIKPDSALEITNPYPIKEKLKSISSDQTVALQGLGLTACDILAELSIGRGGKFIRTQKGCLEYSPSGNEPRIIAYSRTGLPLSGRAENQKGTSEQYHAKFLTLSKVARFRKQGAINFVIDILPLLIKDMEYAYYESYLSQKKGLIAAQKFCNQFLYSYPNEQETLVAKTIPIEDRFSWDKLADPVPNYALKSPEVFIAWLIDYLEADIKEAKKGNISSPIKSASDVLRDLRDIIRDVIDFKGLTEESHRWVDSVFIPLMNRIAVGPPKERIEEMVALLKSGVLKLNLGPSPEVMTCSSTNSITLKSTVWPELEEQADIKIHAKISMHSPKDDGTKLWQNLLAKKYTRLYFNGNYHPGGIDVTQNMNVIDANGIEQSNIWALGIPTEGNKFYTFIVPRPGVNSTAIVDAGRAVNTLFKQLSCTPAEGRQHVTS